MHVLKKAMTCDPASLVFDHDVWHDNITNRYIGLPFVRHLTVSVLAFFTRTAQKSHLTDLSARVLS